MTTLVEQVFKEEGTISKDANDNISIYKCRKALRSKEREIKSKCNKVLKRKFKKYKLRQDGKEDQDILDVSIIFESSLFIKTPNEKKSSAELEQEQLRPINYLFKMGKRNQAIVMREKSLNSKAMIVNETNKNENQPSPTSEEKKQTNAFKLLMDSRNKSMGRNSPGKEKPIDETETQEILEKKNSKAKRNLLLQKMAESKGSLKKKELEEKQARCINKKMEKRAERLKTLISNIEPKSPNNEKKVPKVQNGCNPLNSLKTEVNEELPVKTLQLVNMFTEIEHKVSPQNKEISKEDSEFLKKLSPSLKKKESMLSYFKKVENEPDTPPDNENDNSVIKVKLGKLKKKGRNKKLSLNTDSMKLNPAPNVATLNNEIDTEPVQIPQTQLKETEQFMVQDRKRKRQSKTHTFCDDAAVSSLNILASHDDGRSRRNPKRPVRYTENGAGISSSDEELHVFTPKKKKHSISKTNENEIIIVDVSLNKTEAIKKSEKRSKISKSTIKRKDKTDKVKIDQKPMKLAPIFSSKSQPDPALNEAKQKFLQSGVPEKLKKMMSKQLDTNIVTNNFLKVIHIQQLDGLGIEPSIQLNFKEYTIDNQKDAIIPGNMTFKMLLCIETSPETFSLSPKQTNPQTVLQSIKEKYPRYPVFRTYRLLRGKKKGDYKSRPNYLDLDKSVEVLNASIDNQNENPEQLSWSDKYKPLAASQIIGNFESVKELRKWLVSWTEMDMKTKGSNGCDSDSSDFCQSDDDSKDSVKSSNNLLVLSGPVGSGKTSSVYAIAAELSIKVIEVNASSKRTGKIMLQDLQEATQSHKVNRQTSSNENSQNSQKSEAALPIPTISNLPKKRGRPKKIVENAISQKQVLKKKIMKSEKCESTIGLSASQECTRTCMSLILIDDADIVFDQDDGFCSAIVQLVHSSKRPVILITSSLSCPHLQRFIQSSKILKMNPLLPNIVGTWLDIMCLADSGMCWPGIGSKVLNYFKGDVRRTIHFLQFYVCSQEQGTSQDTESCSQNTDCRLNVLSQDTESCSQNTDCRHNVDDEASNMSWADRDGEDNNPNDKPSEINNSSKGLMLQVQSRHYSCPNVLFNTWWNVPRLLDISELKPAESLAENNALKSTSKSLKSISQALDCLSLSDFYSNKSFSNIGNLYSVPWFSEESHSVSELENFDKYDRHYGTSDEIAYELANSSIHIAQGDFGCAKNIDLELPGMSEQRKKERTVSRHNNLTSYLSPQAVLDRKALALDYWPSCRAICRIEKSKTDTNSKRNNRFCHYLKSLSVLCKNDSFDKLANSLCPSEIKMMKCRNDPNLS